MEKSLPIQFSNKQETFVGDVLWMEEKGWEGDSNKITYGNFYSFTASRLVNISSVGNPYDLVAITEPSHDCGVVEGKVFNTIYVYRLDRSVHYSLKSSVGSLGDKSSEEILQQEVINFNLENSYKVRYPVSGSISHSWQGTIFDESGSATSPPSISLEQGNLLLSKKVYGVLKISYNVIRDVVVFTVDVESIMDDLFAGAIYAIYNDGIAWLLLSKPPSVTTALLDEELICGWQWGPVTYVDLTYPEGHYDSVPQYAPNVDTEIKINYCTGLLESVEQS